MEIDKSIDLGVLISSIVSLIALIGVYWQTQRQIMHNKKMKFSEKLLENNIFNTMYNNLENTFVSSDCDLKYGVIEMDIEMSYILKFNSLMIHYLTTFKPKIHKKILKVLNDNKLYSSLKGIENEFCDLLYNNHGYYYLIGRDTNEKCHCSPKIINNFVESDILDCVFIVVIDMKFTTIEKPESYGKNQPIYFSVIELCDYIESKNNNNNKTKIEFWSDISKYTSDVNKYENELTSIFESEKFIMGKTFSTLFNLDGCEQLNYVDLNMLSELYMSNHDKENIFIGTHLVIDKGTFPDKYNAYLVYTQKATKLCQDIIRSLI